MTTSVVSINRQSALCGSIAFTINRLIYTVNDKLQQGYAIIQNEKLQILSDGNISSTFNLKDLILVSTKNLDNISEFEYGLHALFQSTYFDFPQNCVEVDLYTNDESLHNAFYHCFINYPDQDNNDGFDDKQESQPLVEGKRVEVALYEMSCEGLCGGKYCAEQLYFCVHENCKNYQEKILCDECGVYSHKKRSHPFYTDKEYICCVQDLMDPDDKQFKSGKLDGELLQRGIKSVQQILFYQRWYVGPASYSLGMNGGSGASFLIVASTEGSKVVPSVVGVAAIGAGIGTFIGTAIEWAYIGSQLYNGRISKEEAIKLGVTAFVANGVSAGTYFGVMALGAAAGTPLGPIGSVIGAIIGAIVIGLGTRYAVNKLCEKYFKNKHLERAEFLKEALKYFFDNEQFDIEDGSKFNEKILKRRYHRLAVIYHPDRKDGDHSEWLKLSAYYGILTAVIELQIETGQEMEMVEGIMGGMQSIQ